MPNADPDPVPALVLTVFLLVWGAESILAWICGDGEDEEDES